jgi:hypothetical protein
MRPPEHSNAEPVIYVRGVRILIVSSLRGER